MRALNLRLVLEMEICSIMDRTQELERPLVVFHGAFYGSKTAILQCYSSRWDECCAAIYLAIRDDCLLKFCAGMRKRALEG